MYPVFMQFVDEKADRLNSDPKIARYSEGQGDGKQISMPCRDLRHSNQAMGNSAGRCRSVENNNTTLNRALNRRVEVTIGPADCGMTIPGALEDVRRPQNVPSFPHDHRLPLPCWPG